MKGKWLYCVLISSVLTVLAGCLAFAEPGITVRMDGEPIAFDVPPQLVDDRTMVPMRKIFEVFGADVTWDGETQTATAARGDNTVQMQIGNPVIMVDGQPVTLDVPPQLIDDRTLVPVRAVAEGLRAQVEWDGDTQTVMITTAPQQTVRAATDPERGALYGYGNDGIAELQYNARYLFEQSLLPETVLENADKTIEYLKTGNTEKMTENVLAIWEQAAANVIMMDAIQSEEEIVIETEADIWALIDQRRPVFGLDDSHILDVSIESLDSNTYAMVVELKDTEWTLLSPYIAVAYHQKKELKVFTLERSLDFLGSGEAPYMLSGISEEGRQSYTIVENDRSAFVAAVLEQMIKSK